MVAIGAPTQRTHNVISQSRYHAICVDCMATPCALHYGVATVSRID